MAFSYEVARYVPRETIVEPDRRLQPIRSKTKTNPRDLVARVFSRLAPASCSDWFIGLSASVASGQNNYFGFGFTTLTLKTALFRRARNKTNQTHAPTTEVLSSAHGYVTDCALGEGREMVLYKSGGGDHRTFLRLKFMVWNH